MTEPIYTDPSGFTLAVNALDGDAVIRVSAGSILLVPADDVPEFATSFLKALCAAVGLPEPEVVFPTGSLTMAPGEDWWKVVGRAGRQHATLYPDPVEAAKAAAWAVGGEFE